MRFLDGYVHVDGGDERAGLRVKLQIGEESVTLASEDGTLGSWKHPAWGAEQVAPDRFQISVDGERFTFAPDNLLEFKYEVIPELAAHQTAVSRHRARHWSRRAAVPAAVGTAIVLLAVVAGPVLAAVAAVFGALLLLLAIFGQLDAEVGARFPARWNPNRVLLIGLGILVGGGLLGWLS